ncbi:hypothetical protein H0H93_008473 [Arthromyces matolae]|nr:hypothetical protein H0H93_008473 [Arthromyces matolae]
MTMERAQQEHQQLDSGLILSNEVIHRRVSYSMEDLVRLAALAQLLFFVHLDQALARREQVSARMAALLDELQDITEIRRLAERKLEFARGLVEYAKLKRGVYET